VKICLAAEYFRLYFSHSSAVTDS